MNMKEAMDRMCDRMSTFPVTVIPVDIGLWDLGPFVDPECVWEWSCVRIGHWMLGITSASRGRKAYWCMSRCGEMRKILMTELAVGGPKTCAHCHLYEEGDPPLSKKSPFRPGFAEDKAKTLKLFSEDYVATVIEHSAAPRIDESTNLKSRTVLKEWAQLGTPLLSQLLGLTQMGRVFGWKANVRDCYHRESHNEPLIRIQVAEASKRRVTMTIQPANSTYCYRVDVSTPRTDIPWGEIESAIVRAIKIIMGEEPAVPPVTPNGDTKPVNVLINSSAPVLVNGTHTPTDHVPIVDLDRLLKLRSAIDVVSSVGKDINEIYALKGKVKCRIETARDRLIAVTRVQSTTKQTLDQEQKALTDAETRYQELSKQLRDVTADRDIYQKRVKDLTQRMDEANLSVVGPEKEMEDAQKELQELEALEADRLKVVGGSAQLAQLLEALSKVGG